MLTDMNCPFCGNDDISIEEGSTHRWAVACCVECGATSAEVKINPNDEEGTRGRAFDAWNRRSEVKAEREPVAWETTGYGLVKYVTDSRYRKFSRTIQAYYKPYKCSSCTTPQPCPRCSEYQFTATDMEEQHTCGLAVSKERIEELQAKVASLTQKNEKLKTVPMKYQRMEFNAQLQNELNRADEVIALGKDCIDNYMRDEDIMFSKCESFLAAIAEYQKGGD